MPVPKYERQVAPAALPSASRQGAPMLGASPVGEAVSAYSRELHDMGEKAKQEADNAALMEASAKATQARNNLVFGKGGLLERKGHAALKAPDELGPEFDKQMGEIESSLGNEAQRAAFARLRQQQREEFNGKILGHVYSETEQIKKQAFESGLGAAIDDVQLNYRDKGKAVGFMNTVSELIEARGSSEGWDEKMKADAKEQAISQANRGIIQRELANNNYPAAENWYSNLKQKGGLTGNDITWVEDQLSAARKSHETQVGLAQANKLAQDYLLKYSNEGVALSDFDANEGDKPFASEAKAIIRQGFSYREDKMKSDYSKNMSDAIDIVEKGGFPTPESVAKLSEADRRVVNRLVAEGPGCIPEDSDLGILIKMKKMAASDPENFKKQNIPALKLKLSAEDYRGLRDMQLGMIAQKPDAEAQAKSFLSVNELVDRKFKEAGFKGTDKDYVLGADLFSRAQAQWEKDNPGKKLPVLEAERIANEMLQKVDDARMWRFDKPAFLTTIDAVPDSFKSAVGAQYDAAGGDPTQKNRYILDQYISAQRAKNAK